MRQRVRAERKYDNLKTNTSNGLIPLKDWKDIKSTGIGN
jgi:hypothetical protein